ncbi:5716_t:CDS:2, partial [Scutellospora calospora]
MSVSSTAAAAMASLASRMAALENELDMVDKEMTDDLDDYTVSNSQKEKMQPDEHLDYYSDQSSPLNGSLDNFSTSTSISRHSDLTKSVQDFSQPTETNGHLSNSISSNYASRTPSYDISRISRSSNNTLDDSIKAQLEKKHAEELEKARQELENTRNKHWSELQKSKNELAEQNNENEPEITNLSQLNNQVKSELNTLKDNFENEKRSIIQQHENDKRSIIQQHEKEKDSLLSEHSKKFSNLSKSHEDTESKINQLLLQHETEKKDLESKLVNLHRSEKEKLLAEIKKKEESEANWILYKKIALFEDYALKVLNVIHIQEFFDE